MRWWGLLGVLVVPVLMGADPASDELTIALPAPIATFRPGPGIELVQTNCVLCHSADYLSNQPPFDRAFWKKTVEKMRTAYGAPITEENVELITDYLVKAYGTPSP